MNRMTRSRPGRLLFTVALLLTLSWPPNADGQIPNANGQPPNANGQQPRLGVQKIDVHTKNNVKQPLADSIIEDRLVELALTQPLYDASAHQERIAYYKVKSAKKSWFNLLTISANYNDQTFATQQTTTPYVYPKYFFGLTIPIGTIVGKSSEIKGAREEVKISQDNRENLARTIRTDVLSRYAEYKTARALVVLESQVVDDIHAAFLQAEKRFNDGSVTIELYSDASRNYSSEMTKLLNLQLQQDLIKLEIEKMIGVKLETVIN